MLGELLGPYRLDAEIGSGGMGSVYRAHVESETRRTPVGTVVAVKVLHAHLLDARDAFRRFLREAEIGTRIAHGNVVRTFDVDASMLAGKQLNYIVMEYVEGQTLAALVREVGRLPERLCRHIGEQIANGLEAIHELGVVHRDIKPENVLITPDDEIKIMDLGVARLVDEALRLSQTGSFVGSLEYAAPEQFRAGGADIDERADLHALGLVLYELATGFVTFGGDDVPSVIRSVMKEEPRRVGRRNPQISAFFEELVHKLLRKDPSARFATATQVASILREGERSSWWATHATGLRVRTRRPLRRVRIPRETALYGRDAEVARLEELYAKVKQGEGQVVLIEGEAGIGKTRLVDEFVGGLQERGADPNFLFGSYPPGGAATAAGAFSTAYREQFGDAGLEKTLADYVPAGVIPAFAALLRGDAVPAGAEALTKDTLQAVFAYATRALAAERPTIVLIDDLHFTPDEGRALFAALAASVPGHPIMLIGTARPGALPTAWTSDLDRLPHTTRTELARLGPKDLTELLVDAFHSQRLAEELGFQIAAKSDGNPFFVFEIVQGLRNANVISRGDDGTWVTTGVVGVISIPSSVAEMIQARIADLGEEDKDLLELAACWGFEFDPLVVAEAAELGRLPALKRLARIERSSRLVRSAGRGFVFDHHQVQEVLYSGLPELLREDYHRALAEACERQSGAAERDPDEVAGLLAMQLCDHFLAAGCGDRALRYLGRALAHLAAGYMIAEAVELADRVLAPAGLLTGTARVETLLEQARRLDTLGRRAQQLHVIEEAIDIADSVDDPSARARARRLQGWYLLSVQRYADARDVFEEALLLAQLAGDRRSEAEIIGNLGLVFARLGRHADAIGCYRRQLEIADDLGFRGGITTAHGNLAYSLARSGDRVAARRHYEKCLEVAHEIGRRRDEAVAMINLAEMLVGEGLLEDAAERYRQGLVVCREIGFRRGEAGALAGTGILNTRLGRLEEALVLFERALEISEEIGSRDGRVYALVGRAGALEHLTRHADARADLAEALRIASDSGAQPLVAAVHVQLGRIALALGEDEPALAQLEEALIISEEVEEPSMRALALALLATVRGERTAEALLAFNLAADDADAADCMEPRYLLWRCTGDEMHLREANRLLEDLWANAPPQDRESMLANVPLHRDIRRAAQEAGI